MQPATDIGRVNSLRRSGCEGVQFLSSQPTSEFWLQKGVGARGAAAQMRIGYRLRIITQISQQGRYSAAESRTVSQGARVVDGDARGARLPIR